MISVCLQEHTTDSGRSQQITCASCQIAARCLRFVRKTRFTNHRDSSLSLKLEFTALLTSPNAGGCCEEIAQQKVATRQLRAVQLAGRACLKAPPGLPAFTCKIPNPTTLSHHHTTCMQAPMQPHDILGRSCAWHMTCREAVSTRCCWGAG